MDRRLVAMREALARGLSARLRVEGASMVPSIADGQRVVVQPLGDTPLAVGDVVACEVQGRLRVHRVVSVGDEEVVTRGDANPGPDPPLRREAVLGRVVGQSPGT